MISSKKILNSNKIRKDRFFSVTAVALVRGILDGLCPAKRRQIIQFSATAVASVRGILDGLCPAKRRQ
jgi:hypothetical protein